MNRVELPVPCPQSWQQLTPASTGRYCSSCQKTVVDFTDKTDAEILALLRIPREKALCGRFRATQIGRPLQPAPAWAAWLAALAVVLSSCDATPSLPAEPTALQARSGLSAVEGRVLDRDTGQPLAGACVTSMRDSTRQAFSNASGYFTLMLPDELLGSQLFVSGVQSPTRQYMGHMAAATPHIQVSLQALPAEPMALGEVRLSSYPGYQPGDTIPPPPPPKLSTVDFTAPE
ncbi:hypothetical protein [Hymenobacter koreensis]|uniref:Carboxypeptidase regulatory-like domain-containing protein n=1 Tax=Hymenobacter koreensis TaxID=1084523 RepID=A0ABP8IXW1_9BACT